MKGRMYAYQRVGNKNHSVETFTQALNVAIKSFTLVHGYKPHYVIVNEEEAKGDTFPIPVMKVTSNCPIGHFILYPVVERRCRQMFEGDRIPCRKLKSQKKN